MLTSLGKAESWRLGLAFILLACGCAGGTYAPNKSASLGAYEANPAGKSFGPPGG